VEIYQNVFSIKGQKNWPLTAAANFYV